MTYASGSPRLDQPVRSSRLARLGDGVIFRPLVGLACVFAVGAFSPSTEASVRISAVTVTQVRLQVNRSGQALVSYVELNGKRRNILASGAINARHPSTDVPQISFTKHYTSGRVSQNPPPAKRFNDACAPYDGPALVLVVAACRAPDGTYWALQSWQRLQPMRGFDPFRPEHTADELHLSHWEGQLPVLEVYRNWTYGGGLQGMFGRLTYLGVPVHGFRTPSPRTNDPYSRMVYIDTFNSVYGPDWKRDTAIATHRPTGTFCYTFVAQAPPPGYPSSEPRGPGLGEQHRITVMGPGVTPILRWEGPRLDSYSDVLDAPINELFDQVMAGDRMCAVER